MNIERRPNTERLIVLISSHYGLHLVWFLIGPDQTKKLWLALTVLNLNIIFKYIKSRLAAILNVLISNGR